MRFEIMLMAGPSVTEPEHLHEVALPFLNSIGYMPAGYDPRTGAETVLESVPYRLFTECFLGRLDTVWSVGEIARSLKTSIPTVYRHLDKLAALDILGQGGLENDESRKGYFIRYHDLSQAWRFTEVNMELSLLAYRRAVDAIQKGLAPSKRPADKEPPRAFGAEGDFCLRLENHPFRFDEKWESIAVELFSAVDYLTDSGGAGAKKIRSGVPFRLLTECLLGRPDQGWTIDDLSARLETTKPTVYRYLHKLGRLGVLERSVPEAEPEAGAEGGGAAAAGQTGKAPQKRRYRIRRGNLSKAWNATEYYARAVMKNYRRTVDCLSTFGRHGEG
jgi:predicted transcriptional regulator